MRRSGLDPLKSPSFLPLASGSWSWSASRASSGELFALTEDAAQSNLQTALTGGNVFYSSNHDSFTGIGGGTPLAPGVSSIAKLATGLK